jgi:hypothetical protein
MNSKTTQNKIPKRIVDKMDKMFRDYSYESLDKDYAFAYHPRAMGLTLDEWMRFIEDYAQVKDRKYFWGLNEYQRPTVFFDATDKKEWDKVMKLEGNAQVRFYKQEKGEKRVKPRNKITRFVKQ